MGVTLTIDGRRITVEPGTTLLSAARRMGIDVPTLCHSDRVPPTGSCFLCVVHVQGRRTLVPSCVAPAEEGMVVTTDSEEIRAARRTALELLLSDHVGDCEAPCTLACPAGMNIPEMLRHIRAGNDREALATVKERIPFAGALGRVCPRYCERACRRGDLDEPIAVCALKRFPADRDLASAEQYTPSRRPSTGKKVAVVGAGPAGLTAAFYLLREGYECTVFDRRAEAGGLFRFAVPAYRLPREALAGDIDVVRRLGAEFQMNTTLGLDVGLDDLSERYDAVFLATGAGGREVLSCEGAGLAVSALGFLEHVAAGATGPCGGHVLVAGFGNEALDAARCAVRLGAERVTVVHEGRFGGALSEQQTAAREEGVQFIAGRKVEAIRRTGSGLSVTLDAGGGADSGADPSKPRL